MKIVVVTRCYNEEKNIPRFLNGYSFADKIIVSDGGSTDNSVALLSENERVSLLHFDEVETVNGERWNPDNSHIQFVIDAGKAENPDWLILDDMDDVPNFSLKKIARDVLWTCEFPQVNAFRLYMWGDDQYFPKMNNNFDMLYTSLWAWKPSEIDIHTDMTKRHGTILGTKDTEAFRLNIPMCLLHKSWHPDTIDKKVEWYNKIGLPTSHPLKFAGVPEKLPGWATE